MCQTVCIQIKPDVLSGLIWAQPVCKKIAAVDKFHRKQTVTKKTVLRCTILWIRLIFSKIMYNNTNSVLGILKKIFLQFKVININNHRSGIGFFNLWTKIEILLVKYFFLPMPILAFGLFVEIVIYGNI